MLNDKLDDMVDRMGKIMIKKENGDGQHVLNKYRVKLMPHYFLFQIKSS